VTAGSVWDGGRSNYTSTCNPCGGKGVFPAREAEYHRQQAASGHGNGNGNGNGYGHSQDIRELPRAIHPMPNLNMSRRPK